MIRILPKLPFVLETVPFLDPTTKRTDCQQVKLIGCACAQGCTLVREPTLRSRSLAEERGI